MSKKEMKMTDLVYQFSKEKELKDKIKPLKRIRNINFTKFIGMVALPFIVSGSLLGYLMSLSPEENPFILDDVKNYRNYQKSYDISGETIEKSSYDNNTKDGAFGKESIINVYGSWMDTGREEYVRTVTQYKLNKVLNETEIEEILNDENYDFSKLYNKTSIREYDKTNRRGNNLTTDDSSYIEVIISGVDYDNYIIIKETALQNIGDIVTYIFLLLIAGAFVNSMLLNRLLEALGKKVALNREELQELTNQLNEAKSLVKKDK